jgi:hypothetical protein
METMPSTWKFVLAFILDIVYGVVLFVLVGLAALGLGVFVHWQEGFHILPTFFIQIERGMEYVLFFIDCLGFSFLVVMSFIKLLAEILRHYKWR